MQNIRELVQKQDVNIYSIITNQGISTCIKNQDPIIKTIFTYENLERILDYMIQEQPVNQFVKEQTETDRNQRVAMIHFAVTEILCSECHHITNLLFAQPKPLIEKLLSFLNNKEHYVLASSFSKAMVAITKRVSNPSNRFNGILCRLLFDKEKNFMLKIVNHLYSESMIECIVRWLSLNSYKISNDSDSQQHGEPKQTLYDHRVQKKQFLLKILNAINNHQFDYASVQTSINLFNHLLNQHMLQNQGNQNKIVSVLNKKSKNSAITYELFSLICDIQIIQKIFEVGYMETLGVGKLKLIKLFVSKYKQAQPRIQQKFPFRMLYEAIQIQMLEGVLAWVQFWVKKYFDEKSLVYRNNTILLASLQLLQQLQNIDNFRQNIIRYYTQNPQESVDIIIKTVSTKNNLIQLVQSRIIRQLLNRLNCYEFGKRLLLNGIVKVIDEQTVREHVVKWAEDILQHFDHVRKQDQHIFENEHQQSQWQHVRQLVGTASEIKVGSYRLNPSNIYFCYSQQKAMLTFGSFLSNKPIVIYNQKANSQQKLQSQKDLPFPILDKPEIQMKKKLQTKHKPQDKNNTSLKQNVIKEIDNQQLQHNKKYRGKLEERELEIQEPACLQILRAGYLSYNLQQLLSDL